MKVALYCLTPHVSDDEANAAGQALAEQANGDYACAWGLPEVAGVSKVEIDYLGRDTMSAVADAPPPGYDARMVLFGAPAEQGALGDHEDDPSGCPYMRVFADPVLDNGGVVLYDQVHPQNVSLSSVMSHELLEMLGDRYINVWVDCLPFTMQDGKIATSTAQELCDAVEGTSYAFSVAAAGKVWVVSVSDFLLPSWFNPVSGPAGTLYSKCGSAPGPFKLAPGGYAIGRSAGPGTEQQAFGETYQLGHAGPPAWKLQMKKDAQGRGAQRLAAAA